MWIDDVWLPLEFSPKRPIEDRLLEHTKLGFTPLLGFCDGTHVLMNLVKVGHNAALLIEEWERNGIKL